MTMLRTNLATKPFYNERLVSWLIAGAAVLVIAFTAFNVSQYLRLSGRQGGLEADAARDEGLARTLTARAAEARGRIDAKSLERVRAQAAEANGIIDARTFPWTMLFDDIEATLPPTVMLTAITPSIEADGTSTVRLTVLGRTVEAIDDFIEKLEATKRFENVQPSTEVVTEEGLFQTLVMGRYLAVPPAAPATPATPPVGPAAPTSPGRQGAR
jgi:Tfp pilus assembly protein PilN